MFFYFFITGPPRDPPRGPQGGPCKKILFKSDSGRVKVRPAPVRADFSALLDHSAKNYAFRQRRERQYAKITLNDSDSNDNTMNDNDLKDNA